MNTVVQYRLSGGTAREIAASVEAGVRRGGLSPGDRLPPVRHLADLLGVSPATVASAYRDLRRRGITAGAGRAGTRIREQRAVGARLELSAPPGARDLLSGGPDPALLPDLPLAVPPRRMYAEPPVAAGLRRLAARQLAADGIDPAHLAVTGGALDGVERVLGAWLAPGDRVIVEDPGHPAALDLVAAMGVEAVAVPLDDLGVRPDGLESALARGVGAALLTPRAQSATGAAWDAGRSHDLRRVLARHPGVLVVEDDHAGPVAGEPAWPVCQGRDRWVVIRSVSKSLGPDLRLAVLAGDEATIARVEGRQALGTGWVSYHLQETVARLWDDPATPHLLRRAAEAYARRGEALRSALRRHGIAATGRSGFTTWIPASDEERLTGALLAAGWAVAPGRRFRVCSAPGVRVSFARLRPGEAAAFAGDLARCLRLRASRTD